ncbi:MAG: hypothetical protein B7X51_11155 [Pseudomonas sp. 34-62-33]|nr:MAG: hypothetical protein B7X51_11155 [Pseudomonas sp. 34-62-33]
MNRIEQIIASGLLDNEIVALRFAASQERKAAIKVEVLRRIARKIAAQARLDTKAGQDQAIRDFSAEAKEVFDAIASEQANELQEFAELTSKAAVATVNSGLAVELFKQPPRLSVRVESLLIDGAPTAEWWRRQSDAARRAFAQEVRTGFVSGETTDEIARRIVGMRGQPGIVDVSLRQARSLAHSSVMTVANASVQEAIAANDDLVKGYYWVSTLDSRTCFPAGTLVETPGGGRKKIENLRAGDIVIGGSRVPRKVLGASSKKARRLVRIILSNGEKMECTPDHLILKSDGTWCEAGKLNVSDLIAKKLK